MTVLITGANRGIGRSLFERYQQDGTAVLGTSRAGRPPFLPLDVTDSTSQAHLTDVLNGRPIETLICNAGIYLDKTEDIPTGYPADMWARTFATNVTGVFQTIQSVLPNLLSARTPKIAIISSQMASHRRAPGGSLIYRASKAAVLNVGRNLAADLRGDGIAVGIFDPGWVRTDMGGAEADISLSQSVDGLVQRFADLTLATTGCFLTWDGQEQSF